MTEVWERFGTEWKRTYQCGELAYAALRWTARSAACNRRRRSSSSVMLTPHPVAPSPLLPHRGSRIIPHRRRIGAHQRRLRTVCTDRLFAPQHCAEPSGAGCNGPAFWGCASARPA
jgi:hypothetical protein